MEEYEYFKSIDADLAIVVAYGQIIPKEFLDLTKKGFINIHASLLPKWRGAAPIQRSIMNLDKETGG
jgi:methionyl-tRNA formyltransferase